MAIMRIIVETDLIGDVVRDFNLIATRIRSRHGAAFRALDRRLCKIIEDGPTESFPVHQLEDGRLVVAPSGELTDIVTEARRLGVI